MESTRKAGVQQDGEQDANWRPPRGVRWFEDHSRPSPFFVQWREAGSKKTKAFDSERNRLKWTKTFIDDREKKVAHGIADFDPKEWLRWLEFKRLVGEADPLQIAFEWKQRSADRLLLFKEVARRYLEARELEGIDKATLKHAKSDVNRMLAYFDGLRLNEVTAERIRAFLTVLETQMGFLPVTRRNHYKRLNAMFNWAKREGLATVNPCEAVVSPTRDAEEVTVMSVKDAFTLFKTAWSLRPDACARLALEAFAGLRFSSAARLVKDDINFVDRGVTLPAPKIKTRRRHHIEHLPDNLWAWLDASPAQAWTMTERQYLNLKGQAFALATVQNPGNVLRHSFCSYHVSVHADAARTAVILCHSNPRMLYQHYRGRATGADGKLYFAITPQAVATMTWEQFVKTLSA
jgi:integrase